MKLLITAQDVKTRMALPDFDALDDTLNKMIPAAQLRVEGALDSKLQAQANTDLFFMDSEFNSSVRPGRVYRMYLKTGLLDLTTAPVLTFGDYWNDFSSGGVVPTTDYKIDPIKGIVYLDERSYGDKYVQVQYNSGYTSGNQLPDWVRELIVAYVPLMLNITETTNRSEEAQKMYETLIMHAETVASPYRRNRGFCLQPML